MESRLAPPEQLLSPEAVAGWFGVSLDWVYDRTSSGELPHYRLGRHLRYSPSEVRETLKLWHRGSDDGSRPAV
jgi:excisionase family DNA binding protein